eukprot:6368034-Prymnesium_polylepis.1
MLKDSLSMTSPTRRVAVGSCRRVRSVHGPNGTAVSLSRSVYHSTADQPRAHARHGTLRARRIDGTLG